MTQEQNERAEGAENTAPETPEVEAEAAAEAEASPEEAVLEEAQAVVEGALEEQLAAAKAEAEDWQGRFMRLHAEWDTYRRRMDEQRADERARAGENLVKSLLPVLDDFERSIDYAQNNGEGELLAGVIQVHAKLVDVLEKGGVEVICPEGEAFNALEHQAVATVPNTEAFDETVAQVYQKGYKMGRKVLRPAMVTITSGGPARPAEEEPQA